MLKAINIAGLLAGGAFFAAYFPVWQILIAKWAGSDEYSHAFLTIPIIFYIVWSKRAALREIRQVKFSYAGLTLVIIATVFYLFSLLTQVHTLIALSMFMAIVGAIVYLAGVRAVVELAIPLLLFAMLIPLPEQLYIKLTFPLQLKVSEFSEIILGLSGVTVFREGNIINIPGKSFEVVEACSGLRSVITLMTLSVIMGYFMLRSHTAKLLLFAASIPAAVLVNLVRIVAMVLLYHFFEIDLTEGALHTASGLVVFVVALAILFIIQRILETWELRKEN